MNARLVRKLFLSSVGVTTAVFALALISLYIYRRDQLMAHATADARSSLTIASGLATDRLDMARAAVAASALPLGRGDASIAVGNLVRHSPDIYGASIALDPAYARATYGKDRFMVYCHRTDADTLRTFIISDSIAGYYNYPDRDWFRHPMEHGSEYWTEPYRDMLTSGALMVSYSAPILSPDSTAIGVILADITLDEGIAGIVAEVDSASDHRTYILSRCGQIIMGDTSGIRQPDEAVFTRTLPPAGWTLGHIIDKKQLMRPLRNEMINLGVLFLITVVILSITIYSVIYLTSRPAVRRSVRLEAELGVARRIQQAMLPPQPEVTLAEGVTLAGACRPARAVGGDFYSYIAEGSRVSFVIGDVSGKGVPASLIMAIATGLFKLTAPGATDASSIVTSINSLLCRDNPENMFITMIAGILDTDTRRLSLCRAGHNPPILARGIANAPEILTLPPNLPIGIDADWHFTSLDIPFPAGTTLVSYTDGVTEATAGSDTTREYGIGRLVDTINAHPGATPAALLSAIVDSVDTFTGAQPQTDDITLLIIRG